MVDKQIQPPTKPPLSSDQTAIDDDETGLNYSDDDETGIPPVSNPPVSNNLPLQLDEILKDADKQIDRSSTQKIYDQLSSGIYLKQKKQKFWVDKNLKNCFMLYAKGLEIIWGGTPSYWRWPTFEDQESSEESTFEAAELLDVCWLEIRCKFETFKLSPGTTYEVVFILMMKDPSYGWDIPVHLTLKLPPEKSDQQQHRKENLKAKQRGIWTEIPVGVLMINPHQNMSSSSTHPTEVMDVCLYEYEGGGWKRGLVIKGVCIRPKINP